MTDSEFIAAFEGCTFPKEQWTHAAHIRMAWFYLLHHPAEQALEKIRTGIQRYNASHGGTGYHESVTCVYARLIGHRIASAPESAVTWERFQAAWPELFDRQSPPPLRYYRKETIASEEARRRFVEPDLQPLP